MPWRLLGGMSEWQRRLPAVGGVRVRVVFRDQVDPKVLTRVIETLLPSEQRVLSPKVSRKAS